MADLEAYLKKLTATLPMKSGPTADSSASATKSSPGQTDSGGEAGGDGGGGGPNAYLLALQQNPLLTGLSQPAQLPTAITGFDGMSFLDSVNGYVPPDTNIAVGPNAVVEVVNAQIQFYNKATGAALLPNTPLNTFFGQPTESPFDPVVTYDDIAGRFIVTSATSSGDLLLAVSKDSNPLDGFTSYDLNVTEGGGFSGDFPKLGWNHDEAVITENMYSNSTGLFDHVQVLSFKTSSLFSATPPATLTPGTDYFSTDRTSNDYTLVPATMHGAAAGAPMYFAEENSYEDGANLRVVSATKLLSPSPAFTDTVIPVAAYTAPPLANQPGGQIQTNDSVILSADYRDGLLVAGQNVGLSTDSDAHARWYEFNVSGTPTLAQQGTIAPAPGVSTYYPAIAIGAGDVIGMTYNQSSLSQYPSVYDTGRTSADIKGTMETPVLAHAGTATYSDSAFRWGDYSGIAVDPSAPGSFWSGAEYATSALSGMPANWATWISHFSVVPTVISSNPAPQAVVTGTAPTTFSLTFSEPIDKTSITAGSFKVNGVAANSASLSADGLTITYTFAKTPVTQPGTESMSLPAGSVKGQGDEQGNAAFSASFYYTPVQLQVTVTSPAVGSVLVAPITDLVVQFNKAFDPYSISTADFLLSQGTVVAAKPVTSQSVDLTLSGITQDGTVTLTIPAGAILDTNEVPGAAFTGTYIVQVNSQPFPTTFQSVPPPGSLIYDLTATGAINFAGDSDTYTLPLVAGQTLTVDMSTDSTLQGTITVTDPNNNVIGTATVPASGQTVVLQTAPITTAGTYSFTVAGANGTQGNYAVQAILNAAYKLATGTNNATASAYDLSGAFVGLGTTPASDRAGVIGTIDAAGDGDYYAFHLNAGQSATLAVAGQNGASAGLELLDGSGNLLALPNQVGTASFESINNFVAPATGVYDVVVTGSPGTSYGLVVTRGADFDTEPNNTIPTAQDISTTASHGGPVLGDIQPGIDVQKLLSLTGTPVTGNLILSSPQITLGFDSDGSFITSNDAVGIQFLGNEFVTFGTPVADFTVAYNGTDYTNAGVLGISQIPVMVQNISSGSFHGVRIDGMVGSDLDFERVVAWNDGDSFVTIAEQLTNVGSSAINQVATLENMDPDQGFPLGVGFATSNDVVLNGQLVTAAAYPSAYPNGLTFGLGSSDPRRVVGAQGFFNTDPFAIINNPQDPNGAFADIAINLAYDFGSLNPSQSVSSAFVMPFGTSNAAAQAVYSAHSALADTDVYSFNVNAGDNLTIDTTTPGGTAANGLQFANGLAPTITLFDPSGAPVASDTGGAADGRNDHLTYTALASGTYYVAIAGTKDTTGEYTLSVTGATGGAPPFQVTSTNPAAGSDLNTEVSSMTVSLSDSVLVSSISNSDFTIDGQSATGFTVIDGNSVSFSFPTTVDGVHSVSISGLKDIHGVTLTSDSFTFKTDTVPPFVVSSSIANNAVLTPGNLTEVATFSEPMNTSFTTASSFDLHGNYRNVDYAAASFSWDQTGTVLTINYTKLPTDAYTLTLFAGGFSDLAGNTMTANFVVNFTMPVGTATLSGLKAVNPRGSLVYQATPDDVLVSSTDVATYDLTIDPQQTIALLVTPVTSGLTLTVTVTAPDGTMTTATSPKAGAPALIPGIESTNGGKYVIQVSGGPGEYTLQTDLNALIDPAAHGGPPNGTIGTAQPLDAYANTFASGADRTAVLGSILGTPASFGDALVVETGFNGDVILVNQSDGTILQHFNSPAFSGLYLFDIALAPDNTFYVLGDQNLFTGFIVHMDLQGDTLGTITVPVTDSPGFLSPEGFGLDPRDGSFWIPLTNTATLVHIDASGNLLAEYAVPSNPDDAAVGPDGNIYISQVFSGEVSVFNPTTGTDSPFASSPFPLGVTWSVAGDLWVGDLFGGAEEFDSSGKLINQVDTSGPTAAEQTLSGNIWDTNVFFGLINQFTPTGGIVTQTGAPLFQPGLAVLGDVPNEAPIPPPVFPVYSIQLVFNQA
jgi:hypothetical protein